MHVLFVDPSPSNSSPQIHLWQKDYWQQAAGVEEVCSSLCPLQQTPDSAINIIIKMERIATDYHMRIKRVVENQAERKHTFRKSFSPASIPYAEQKL